MAATQSFTRNQSIDWEELLSDDEIEQCDLPEPRSAWERPLVTAEDLRALNEDSQDGINLRFRQAVTVGDDTDNLPQTPGGNTSRKRDARGAPVVSQDHSGITFASPQTCEANSGEDVSMPGSRAALPEPEAKKRRVGHASPTASVWTSPLSIRSERGGGCATPSGPTLSRSRSYAEAAGASPTSGSGAESPGAASPHQENEQPAQEEGRVIKELTEDRIAKRQKQVDLGKSTVGYKNYIAAVPQEKRDPRRPDHPATPEKRRDCSKRAWDGMVRQWRRRLHLWDHRTEDTGPLNEDGEPITLKSPKATPKHKRSRGRTCSSSGGKPRRGRAAASSPDSKDPTRRQLFTGTDFPDFRLAAVSSNRFSTDNVPPESAQVDCLHGVCGHHVRRRGVSQSVDSSLPEETRQKQIGELIIQYWESLSATARKEYGRRSHALNSRTSAE